MDLVQQKLCEQIPDICALLRQIVKQLKREMRDHPQSGKVRRPLRGLPLLAAHEAPPMLVVG